MQTVFLTFIPSVILLAIGYFVRTIYLSIPRYWNKTDVIPILIGVLFLIGFYIAWILSTILPQLKGEKL